jgi:hypothetical protein
MGFEPQQPSWIESANEFMDWMKLALEEARQPYPRQKMT